MRFNTQRNRAIGAFFLAAILSAGYMSCASRPAPVARGPESPALRYAGWRSSPVETVTIERTADRGGNGSRAEGEVLLGFSGVQEQLDEPALNDFARSIGATRVVVSESVSIEMWCIVPPHPPPGWNAKRTEYKLWFFAAASSSRISGYPPEWARKCPLNRQFIVSGIASKDVQVKDYDSIQVLPSRDGQHVQVAQIDLDGWDESLRPALADFAADYGCNRVVLWDRRQSPPADAPSANPSLFKSVVLYRVPLPNPRLAIERQKQ